MNSAAGSIKALGALTCVRELLLPDLRTNGSSARATTTQSHKQAANELGEQMPSRNLLQRIARLLAILVLASGVVAGVQAMAADQNSGSATLTTDRSDYPPHTPVAVSGTGWWPGEIVKLVFHETNGPNPDVTYSAVADISGRIANSQFAPGSNDYGVIFILTATALRSGITAHATFTDGASLAQRANLSSGSPTNCQWRNGNLHSSQTP